MQKELGIRWKGAEVERKTKAEGQRERKGKRKEGPEGEGKRQRAEGEGKRKGAEGKGKRKEWTEG